ncbi:MAG TPA: hypothetical protein PKD26_13030 [Pyrinomonadaceae bacterium]|nr:hypothetical protein [Pyrinomonadaceae bacterium]
MIKSKLGQFPTGSRLVFRSKKDWRIAVICRKADDSVSISVASPTGYSYRLKRPADLEIEFDGHIPYLASEEPDDWRSNFTNYDRRW